MKLYELRADYDECCSFLQLEHTPNVWRGLFDGTPIADGYPRRFQVPSATGLMMVDQYAWKSNAPSGRKSSAGDFQPKDLRGLALW